MFHCNPVFWVREGKVQIHFAVTNIMPKGLLIKLAKCWLPTNGKQAKCFTVKFSDNSIAEVSHLTFKRPIQTYLLDANRLDLAPISPNLKLLHCPSVPVC